MDELKELTPDVIEDAYKLLSTDDRRIIYELATKLRTNLKARNSVKSPPFSYANALEVLAKLGAYLAKG